jgi:hypothetical protein
MKFFKQCFEFEQGGLVGFVQEVSDDFESIFLHAKADHVLSMCIQDKNDKTSGTSTCIFITRNRSSSQSS